MISQECLRDSSGQTLILLQRGGQNPIVLVARVNHAWPEPATLLPHLEPSLHQSRVLMLQSPNLTTNLGLSLRAPLESS